MSMILRDVYNLAVRCFTEIGSPSPESDAETLLEFYFKKDRTYIMLHFGDSFDESRCEGFFELMDRRAKGTPVQHITGVQNFMGLDFKTTPDALIPRQDTEVLVERVLSYLNNKKAPFGGFSVLDLCTGSGCIAISLASLAEKKVHVTASDLSDKALSLAKENAEKHLAKIRFVQGDLFEPFPVKKGGEGKQLFDVIVSNPPYIDPAVIETLGTEVKDHEPRMALDGGKGGLDFYIRIFREAPFHLKPGGLLALEIGADQGEALRQLSEASGAFQPIAFSETSFVSASGEPSPASGEYIFKDLAGLDRVYLGIRK